MYGCIDIATGAIRLEGKIAIFKGMARADLDSLVGRYARSVAMPNGWFIASAGPYMIYGDMAVFSFNVYNNKLESLAFAAVEPESSKMTNVFILNNALLRKGLGDPGFVESNRVGYRFGWGSVISEVDVKGGLCQVSVLWG